MQVFSLCLVIPTRTGRGELAEGVAWKVLLGQEALTKCDSLKNVSSLKVVGYSALPLAGATDAACVLFLFSLFSFSLCVLIGWLGLVPSRQGQGRPHWRCFPLKLYTCHTCRSPCGQTLEDSVLYMWPFILALCPSGAWVFGHTF